MNKKDFKFCMQQGRGLCHLVLQNEKDITLQYSVVRFLAWRSRREDRPLAGRAKNSIHGIPLFGAFLAEK